MRRFLGRSPAGASSGGAGLPVPLRHKKEGSACRSLPVSMPRDARHSTSTSTARLAAFAITFILLAAPLAAEAQLPKGVFRVGVNACRCRCHMRAASDLPGGGVSLR